MLLLGGRLRRGAVADSCLCYLQRHRKTLSDSDSTDEASALHKCHTYLVVLEAGGLSGLGEAVELGFVGVAEAGLEAGGEERRGEEKVY